jgi:hypothetical protein
MGSITKHLFLLLILVVVPLYITAATSHPDVPPSRPGFDEGAGFHKGVSFSEATIRDMERILTTGASRAP